MWLTPFQPSSGCLLSLVEGGMKGTEFQRDAWAARWAGLSVEVRGVLTDQSTVTRSAVTWALDPQRGQCM